MKFSEVVAQTLAWLQREGRVSYRALRLEFDLTEDVLDALKEELIEIKELVVDKDGKMLVWVDASRVSGSTLQVSSSQSENQKPETRNETSPPSTPHSNARRHTLDARHEAERRQLTVMFCDLVGSTALSEQLDPEEYREVVRAYHETCADVISLYAGHTAQHLGDGLLVYFGYPVAHEDDAARAVRTGLEIITALQKKIPSPPVGEGQGEGIVGAMGRSPLQVRIGIHTGLVVVGEIGSSEKHEILALGETPNLAARLQGLAAPDTVVISAATHRLIDSLLDCRDLGIHTVKGVSTPLQVYQVVGESGRRSRLEAAATKGLTPLVGREEEIGLLRKRWEQAKAGEGQVVLLSGEPGIGKSRLVQILQEQVAQEMSVRVEYRCSSYYQNSAFYPVIEHLQRLLHFTREDSPEDKVRKLEAVVAGGALQDVPLRSEVVALLAALLSLPLPAQYPALTLTPQRQKQKTLEALVAWLGQEAKRHPVLVVVEDVHWVDPSTLEFLSLLLDQAPTTRLLLVLTFRPDFTPPWAMFSHLTQLTLSRLAHRQVEVMVEKVTGGKPLPAEVIQQLITKADGVPLFVEELTKTVLESIESIGPLESVVSVGAHGRAPLQLGIPATLQDALMARLDRLATSKEIAQVGATLGREFSYDLLRTVSPMDESMLQQGLSQLVAAELLYQRGMPPQSTYLFKHALIQDTAYQSLLKSKRQQLHQQIALVLEERFPETIQTQPELLAHHYTEAGLSVQAIPFWQMAGERAAQRSANEEAISHLTKGLELLLTLPDTPERAQQELTLQIALGVPLVATKGFAAPETERAYTRARELCRQLGETPQLFPVLRGLWTFHLVLGEFRTAYELGERLLSLAQRGQDRALLLEAHHELGNTLFLLGELLPARGHLEQGIALYDLQQHRALAYRYGYDPGVLCLSFAARTLWLLGYPDQACQRNNEALALAQEVSHPYSLAFALAWAAEFHHFCREEQAVQGRAEAVVALSAEQGFPSTLAIGTILRGWALAARGQTEEGSAQIRQGLTAWQAARAEIHRPYFLGLLGEACGKVGQEEKGLSLLAEALAVVNSTGERVYEAELYRLRGELTLAQSSVQRLESSVQKEAEECFQKAIEVAQKQQAKSLELRAAMSLARLWQQQGKTAEARDMLSTIYNWFTEGFDTKDLQEAKALLESLSP